MSNIQKKHTPVTFFEQDAVKGKFEAMIGKRAPQFITSVLQIVNSNDLLKNAEPVSIYTAAATAATLDLPLNNNLGFAYIVPFNDRKSGTVKAQFQLGWKGFVQLAQRSGQFKTISVTPVYEGQVDEEDPLSGMTFNWKNKTSNKVVGYASYFKLLNGFEKTMYMTVEQVQAHASKYSQTYKRGYGVWKDDFDAMAQKTVLKLLLSKYAPLSVEMQTAEVADQAVINNFDTMEVEYIDNQPEPAEIKRIEGFLSKCKKAEDVTILYDTIPEQYHNLLDAKLQEMEVQNV